MPAGSLNDRNLAVKAGIIDPTKVVRTVLQHAVSFGAVMLTRKQSDDGSNGCRLGRETGGRRWFVSQRCALPGPLTAAYRRSEIGARAVCPGLRGLACALVYFLSLRSPWVGPANRFDP
jgi:hypothetical protein